MKRCPTCNKTFAEAHLIFCVDDGTPLIDDDADEVTVVRPSADSQDNAGEAAASSSHVDPPAYQGPSSYSPPNYQSGKPRKIWPWALAILLLVGLVIGAVAAAAVLIPRLMRAPVVANQNSNATPDANRRSANFNSNLGSDNSNVDGNNATAPPTDRAQVLSDLKNLEDEWTVANINADRQKLNRILADDYVGISNGRPQGKAEYLKTLERDTAIQHWEFTDLKLTLNGDRATLAGTIKLDVNAQNGAEEQSFHFTDKFVWRDGRWQAIASEVNASDGDTEGQDSD